MTSGLWTRRPVQPGPKFERILGPLDLTNIGIAAIIGAGIFVFLGQEAINTGPAVVIALALAGGAAMLAAFSYAEASAIRPGNGSAYAFAYEAMGNLPGFIVGWLFIDGYIVGNAGVGTGWATFFVSGLSSLGVDLPQALTRTPLEGGIVNLPSLALFVAITFLATMGMRSSTRVNNVLVVLKLAIVLFVIVVGVFLVNPTNYRPFSPGGGGAVLGSTAVLFFAYLGFDTIAATGAEAREPKKHMPWAILISITVCMSLYILMALAVTGVAPSAQLDPLAPVANAFALAGAPWAGGVITAGALVGLATVAYAFHMASARIVQAMALDGFLPSWLGKNSARGVPARAAVVAGIISASAAGFLPLDLLISSSVEANITIFAFVSLGILVLRKTQGRPEGFAPPAWMHAAAIVALSAVVIFGIGDPLIHLATAMWIGLGLIVYALFAHKSSVRVLERIAADTR